MNTNSETLRDDVKAFLACYSQNGLASVAAYPDVLQAQAQIKMKDAPDTMAEEKEDAHDARQERAEAKCYSQFMMCELDWEAVAAIAIGDLDAAALARELCKERLAEAAAAQKMKAA